MPGLKVEHLKVAIEGMLPADLNSNCSHRDDKVGFG
jgi:hypothetical protein